MKKMVLPNVSFSSKRAALADWRKSKVEEPGDDDEELDETPEDVVEMLGFDPKLERGG